MSTVTPVTPVCHSFEWDAKRRRIIGLRFTMDDGSELRIGAHSADIPDVELRAEDPARLVDLVA